MNSLAWTHPESTKINRVARYFGVTFDWESFREVLLIEVPIHVEVRWPAQTSSLLRFQNGWHDELQVGLDLKGRDSEAPSDRYNPTSVYFVR